MPNLKLLLLLALIASSASAVTMDWTPVGNPGNAADSTGVGAVAYSYNIGTYEVTNAQYAEFLNAKAVSDPLVLYSHQAGSQFAGITRSGPPDGPFTYSAIAGRENMPVTFVSFYNALRFTNWLNNGQGAGDTETGAYTLLGGTATPSNGTTVTRNAGATIVLTSEDEWYKAAYHNATGLSATDYFDYPAGSDTQTTCSTPPGGTNDANCGNAVGNYTIKGSYTGSPSPYGTFDQGGNVHEWNDPVISGGPFSGSRGLRGGAFNQTTGLAAADGGFGFPSVGNAIDTGFRVAMIPEPGTGLLVVAGLLGLAGWRRARD